jgi:hypothetical protein
MWREAQAPKRVWWSEIRLFQRLKRVLVIHLLEDETQMNNEEVLLWTEGGEVRE